MLPRLIGVERSALVPISLGEAYERYYATPFNSGTLKAYGDLLSALDAGTALDFRGIRWDDAGNDILIKSAEAGVWRMRYRDGKWTQ